MTHNFGGHFRTSRCSATVQSRDALQALLSPSALGAVLQRGGDPCGRPGGGSAALPTSSLTQSGSRCLLRSPWGWVCSLRSHCRSLAMWNRDPCGRPGGCNVSVRETTYPDECVKTRYRAHRVLFHMFEKTLDLSFVRPMLSWLNPRKHTGTPPPSFTQGLITRHMG